MVPVGAAWILSILSATGKACLGTAPSRTLGLLVPMMWCASKIPPAWWSNSRARIPEQRSRREGKEAWEQEVETQGAVLTKEGGTQGRSLGQPREFPLSEFATFFVATGAKSMRWRNCKMSTRRAEASVRRHIPGLIS